MGPLEQAGAPDRKQVEPHGASSGARSKANGPTRASGPLNLLLSFFVKSNPSRKVVQLRAVFGFEGGYPGPPTDLPQWANPKYVPDANCIRLLN